MLWKCALARVRVRVAQVRMDLLYEKFRDVREHMPSAYERLLLEALTGDHQHFVSEGELQAQWRIFTPALDALQQRRVQPELYTYGGRGPAAADELARRYGMSKFGGALTPYVTLAEKVTMLQLEERAGHDDDEEVAAAARNQ